MEFKEAFSDLAPQSTNDVIIFCDPGKDDAAMLAQILSSPEKINILGIVPGAGNTSLANTVRNTLQICELTDRKDIKVYPGAEAPLGAEEIVDASGAHGLTGFGSIQLPAPALKPEAKSGVDFSVEAIEKADRPVTIISTGGLTDLYLTLDRLQKENPDALKNVASIFMMGGVFDMKEANAPVEGSSALKQAFNQEYAEFNAIFDPIATEGVFRICADIGLRIVLAPLDLTHKVLSHHEDAVSLRAVGNRVSEVLADFVEDVGPWDVERFGLDGNGNPMVPVHDAMTSTSLLHPGLFVGDWRAVRAIGSTGKLKGKTEIIPDATPKNVFVLELDPARLGLIHAAFRSDLEAYDHLQNRPTPQRAQRTDLTSRPRF